jgi:ornithine--oxo-acid transaminase
MTAAALPTAGMTGSEHIELVETWAAHNYKPLPVVIEHAEGVWVTDVDGKRYMDMLAAYSAVNFGHGHPELLAVAAAQLQKVTLTSRAFHNDQLGPLCEELAELCGMEMVLPMNTGAEGVETAIKTARKWGYKVKGVAPDTAKIICCEGNFHGRTTTVVSFSDDPQCRDGFGPFTPGFELVEYGNAQALEDAIDDHTVAFLAEPIQGEAGVLVPPPGYWAQVREICTRKGVLFIADEIQSGLGRCGTTFCMDLAGVKPDIFILGKALGGGIMPISAVVSSRDILGVFNPGDHGSTFGGNPLACAVARKVVAMLKTGEYQAHTKEMGDYLFGLLRSLPFEGIREIRGAGLWAGIELHDWAGTGKAFCMKLLDLGLLCKDTHEQAIRLAPPLVISKDEIDWAFERLASVLSAPVK